MKIILAASIMLMTGWAAAQDNSNTSAAAAPGEVKTLDKDIHADNKSIHEDKQAIRAARMAERARLKDINDQEKAAIAAIKADATKTEEQRTAAIDQIKTADNSKRDAVRADYTAQHNGDRTAVKDERKEIRSDRKEIKAIENKDKK